MCCADESGSIPLQFQQWNFRRYHVLKLKLKLGHSLKKCASMLEARAILERTDQRHIDGFIQLIDRVASTLDEVSRLARTTPHEDRWNGDYPARQFYFAYVSNAVSM